MKEIIHEKKYLLTLAFLVSMLVNGQVSNFNNNATHPNAWGFEPSSGVPFASNATSSNKANPGNIVDAFTQLVSGSTVNVFVQSSDVAHTGTYSALADFSVISEAKFQTWRPSGTADLVGNMDVAAGTYKASIWVYMTVLEAGNLRYNIGKSGYTNVNFDFDLSGVTRVNTWTKLTAEAAMTAGTELWATVQFTGTKPSSAKVYMDDFNFEHVTAATWTGTTDNDWGTATNWDTGIVPVAATNVTISSGSPVISATTGAVANSLTINGTGSLAVTSGGSLIVDGTSTGDITYNVNVPDTNWHLVSSPVTGEQYDDAWNTANSINVSGTGNNDAVSTYNNTVATGNWNYFQTGGGATTFGSGVGYGLKRTSAGNYAFTGTVPTADIAPAITQSSNNWNLVGNGFPSYLKIADLITSNTSNLSAANQAIYVWNAGTSSYQSLTTGYVHPGQAFFINSNVASGTLSLTEGLQSHQTMVTFYRSSNNTKSINLMINDGDSNKSTKINYLEGKTKGLNPGFDIGLFNGVSSDLSIYTHLLSDNTGIAFERQALPDSGLESMVIPLGVKAAAGKEITFTADALNLPTGIKVFLEDRVANTFTRLDEANSEYKITLANAIDGVGRFYLYTTQSSLSVDDTIKLSGVSIFKTDASTLRIAGLPNGKASISLFNILGKQVMTSNFDANGTKDISLPKLETGVYFAKVQTASGKISKKIILE